MGQLTLCVLLLAISSPAVYAQWQPQQSRTDASFRSVSAVSKSVVWAGGSKGTFTQTTDGGANWQADTVLGATGLDFRGVVGFSDSEAMLMSAGPAEKGQARLYQTSNGGKTWQLFYQTSQPGVFFDGIAFWDRQHGIVFSDPIDGKWFILRTDDGGKTWQRIPPGNLPLLLPGEAAFAASHSALVIEGKTNVWIGSSAGRVFRSVDRGKTWAVSQTPLPGGPTSGVFGLHFRDASHGMAVGGDYKQEKAMGANVAITADGGQTWQTVAPAAPPGLKEGLASISTDKWLVLGPSGSSLSADNGKTWQLMPLEGFHAVSCVNEGTGGKTCWAVGAKGRIARQTF
ncbi:MAG: oxidoreductase [Bacteroidetes bacterium]|nr:oxidoreductase [Fibrella sp.]